MGFWTLARLEPPSYEYRAAASLISLAFVVGMATIQYRLRFWSVSRSLRCRQPTASFAETWQEINKIASLMGVYDIQVRVSDSLGQDFLAITHGSSKVIIAGSSSPILLKKRKLDAFRFIISHEIAHFKNRDIFYGYVSIYIWRSLLALFVIIPILSLVNLITSHVQNEYDVWVQIINYALESGDLSNIGLNAKIIVSANALPIALYAFSISVFLLLIRLEIQEALRYREHKADVEASRFCDPEVVRDAFPGADLRPGILGLWQRMMSPHPTVKERLEAIECPKSFLTEGLAIWVLLGGLFVYIIPEAYIGFDLDFVNRSNRFNDFLTLKYNPGPAVSLYNIIHSLSLIAFEFALASRIYKNSILQLSSSLKLGLFTKYSAKCGMGFLLGSFLFYTIANIYFVMTALINADLDYFRNVIMFLMLLNLSVFIALFTLSMTSAFALRPVIHSCNGYVFVKQKSWWLRAMMAIFISNFSGSLLMLASIVLFRNEEPLLLISFLWILVSLLIILLLARRKGKLLPLYMYAKVP